LASQANSKHFLTGQKKSALEGEEWALLTWQEKRLSFIFYEGTPPPTTKLSLKGR
jgi:hypothetical protein